LWFRKIGAPVPERTWKAAGCAHCRYTGYRGRIGVFEVWKSTEADYQLILSQPDEHTFRRALRRRGIHSLFQDGMIKAVAGQTTFSEIQGLAGQSEEYLSEKAEPAQLS
jgi:general secretion pathway protein E